MPPPLPLAQGGVFGKGPEMSVFHDHKTGPAMCARHKLNRIMLSIYAVVAGAIGILSGSWLVFWIAMAIAVIAGLLSGDVRLKPQKRR